MSLPLDRRQIIQVIAMSFGYIAITIFVTVCLLHESFQSHALDLGYFTQTLKYTLEGKLLYTTIGGLSSLAYHFSPVTLLMVPVYWLFPYAETLLVVQAVLLGLSGCLIYILCRINNLEHRTSLFIELLFFVNPLLWGLATFDFHSLAFTIPALLALFIGIQSRRNWLVAISLIVALGSKEDVILIIAIWAIGMTLYSYWKEKKVIRIYPIILLSAIAAYGLAIGVSAIASEGQFPRLLTYGTVRYEYLALPFNEAIIAGLSTLFSSGSIYLFFAYLAPLGYLPLTSIQWCFPALVVLLSNMISTCPSQHEKLLQSQAAAIPFLFMAFIMSMVWIKDNPQIKALIGRIGRRVTIYLCILIVVVSVYYAMTTRLSDARLPDLHEQTIKQVLELIPDDATVTANNSIFPHICSRTDTYMPYWTDPYTPVQSAEWGFPDKETEYVIMDIFNKQNYGGKPFWEIMFNRELDEKYELIAFIDGVRLYRLRH